MSFLVLLDHLAARSYNVSNTSASATHAYTQSGHIDSSRPTNIEVDVVTVILYICDFACGDTLDLLGLLQELFNLEAAVSLAELLHQLSARTLLSRLSVELL